MTFELAGEAVNGKQLIEIMDRLFPDRVPTDIKMPAMDGSRLFFVLRNRNTTVFTDFKKK
jgi:YesN/AraC family two-component response regulator